MDYGHKQITILKFPASEQQKFSRIISKTNQTTSYLSYTSSGCFAHTVNKSLDCNGSLGSSRSVPLVGTNRTENTLSPNEQYDPLSL